MGEDELSTAFNESLTKILVCPSDLSDLCIRNGSLTCKAGHQFSVEDGIPVFTDMVRREPIPHNMEPCRHSNTNSGIEPFVDDWLVNTNGNLYRRARGRLLRYPIPNWPFRKGDGQVLLDIGCGWGRWSIAAARAGFCPVGFDVHVDAVAAAARISRQLRIQADYICGNAEHLPFRPGSIDVLFSYSVLQHLDRSKVHRFFQEAARVLKPQGTCLVQLPNALGLYNMLLQAKRGFRDATSGTFEMRYWSWAQIEETIHSAGLRNLRICTDGFFSQNAQLSDLDLLSFAGKLVVLTSYAGRKISSFLPILTRLADSIWVEARVP